MLNLVSKNKNILKDYIPYDLDFINKLISITQKDEMYFLDEAQKMYDYIYLFYKFFPHEINYQNEIVLKNEYVINNLQKIYNQIQNADIEILDKNETIKIYYYLYDENSFYYWEKKNISVGEKDENDVINTGTNLIFKFFILNWKEFLSAYETFLN